MTQHRSIITALSCCLLRVCLGAGEAPAGLRLPAIFSDHMVLQRDMAAPVWGWAPADEEVTVSIAGQSASAKAGADGKWKVSLKPLAAADSTELVVKGKDKTITIKDVAVGEVWFASGQSNMARVLGKDDELRGKKAAIDEDPQLRLFIVKEARLSDTPLDDLHANDRGGGWVIANARTAQGFSAVGYYFGRDLRALTKRPVGVIAAAIGGVPAQTFVSREVLTGNLELKPLLESSEKSHEAMKQKAAEYAKGEAELLKQYEVDAEQAKKDGKKPPTKPVRPKVEFNPGSATIAYNSMVAPIVSYGIKGVLWYQGESNNAKDYRTLFPALIGSWRKEWGQGDSPFLFVQITYQEAAFREVQQRVAQTVPNVAMVVISDMGMKGDPAHPPDKEPTAARLLLAARALAYGEKVEYSGPVYDAVKFDGPKAIVSFTHVGGGLVAREGGLKGFQLAGSDKTFVNAKAEIVGDTVVVTCDQVPSPVAVRYGFLSKATEDQVNATGGRCDTFAAGKYCPSPSLANKAGLIASPFRTDDWLR